MLNFAVRREGILAVMSMCAQPELLAEYLEKQSNIYIQEFKSYLLDLDPEVNPTIYEAVENKLVRACKRRNLNKLMCTDMYDRRNYNIIDRTVTWSYGQIQTNIIVGYKKPPTKIIENLMRIYPQIIPLKRNKETYIFEKAHLPEFAGSIKDQLWSFENCHGVDRIICGGGETNSRETVCLSHLAGDLAFDRDECYEKIYSKSPCLEYVMAGKPIMKCFKGSEKGPADFSNLTPEKTSFLHKDVLTICITMIILLTISVLGCCIWRLRTRFRILARKPRTRY
jgi:hypothetical protein